MLYEKSCGAVVFTRIQGEIRYVLVQQREGFHGFPKGHMEPGESERETALREIYEELQLRPTLVDGFLTMDEHAIPGKKDVIKQMIYFLAEYEDQEIVFQEEELLSAPLVSYEEAMTLFEYESSRRILTEAHTFLTKSSV
jgi:8-oxo-dGTP pyrophosphatase MutT (NUDIX family)